MLAKYRLALPSALPFPSPRASAAAMFSRLHNMQAWKNVPQGILAGAAAASVFSGILFASDTSFLPKYPWSHAGYYDAFDTASLRRGFEVYRQVCSSCHSMQYRAYRQLIGVTHTEEQAKALARSVEVTDGPNEEGQMFQRPGKLFDRFPKPYPNEEFARYINGGALPPDLSLMVLARPGGENYVFSLLNGYKEAPAGMQLRDGLHYNVYFPGNAISMAKPLSDGQVEWEDGTPATVTQMAKDVTTFLSWAAQPEHDQRKKMSAKIIFGLGYQKRLLWSLIKTKRITWVERGPGHH